MSIERKALVEEILNQCTEIEERVPGYREELRETVIDIITAEAEHEKQRGEIVVKVSDFCKRLGEHAAKHGA
jgi:hypothetical protein